MKRLKQQDKGGPQLKQQDSKGSVKSAVSSQSMGAGPGEDQGLEDKLNGLEKGRGKLVMSEQRTIKTVKLEKLSVKQQPSVKLEEEEERASDSKSEGSDMECSSVPGMVSSFEGHACTMT